MDPAQKILLISPSLEEAERDLGRSFLPEEIRLVTDPVGALVQAATVDLRGVFVSGSQVKVALDVQRLAREHSVLDILPIGVLLVDREYKIVWTNRQFRNWCGNDSRMGEDDDPVIGTSFYRTFGMPQITGPVYCPFHTVFETGKPIQTGLRSLKNEYYQMDVTPIPNPRGPIQHLIVILRDVSELTIAEQRFETLLKVGAELPDLTPDQLQEITIDERVDILTANIIRNTMEVLNFNVAEIRLLSLESGALEPLIAIGMDDEATSRRLYARSEGNGITGYVGACGKSYLCEDTLDDPLYLEGLAGARSSLTVPLLYHEEVIGTFNVESREPRAFTEKDLRFLEIFARDVAAAIHTLDLLTAEKAGSTAASVEAIHSAVALPIDQILNDAVYVLARQPDLDKDLLERLHNIQTKARGIKSVIQKVGEKMTPAQAHPFPPTEKHPLLRGSTVLVVDADESVRIAANEMLSRYGCSVESAPHGEQAILMIQNTHYDAIISDIRLSDYNGFQFLLKLRDVMDVSPVPLILMTGFGYDPGHVVVNARKEGVDTFLYKPFRLDQLILNTEKVIERNRRKDR